MKSPSANHARVGLRLWLPRFALFVLGLASSHLAAQPAAPAPLRKLAVTIDDGPAVGVGNDLAAFVRVADGLREAFVAEKVPAIMFVNERVLNVDGQRDARAATLQRWLEAGLELGNHTYSHPNLGNIGLTAFLDDIVKGEVITRPLVEARRQKLEWFRYPFLASGSGETAQAIEDFLARRGYRIAPVTVDYADYNHAPIHARHLRAGNQAGAEAQFATMMQALDENFSRAEARAKQIFGYEPPQVLLIHCNEMNSLTLRQSLRRLRERGYAFVSLGEAMADPAYATPGLPAGAMGGGGFLNALATAKRPTTEK